MNREEVEGYLTQRGIEFKVTPQENCDQLRISSGEVVNFFKTGTVQIQGKKTPLRQSLEQWKASGIIASPGESETPAANPPTPGPNKKIFVVYGHDSASRDGLELLLRRMGLDPIILANLPASGDTIIEKLEKYLKEADQVGFACVLLTPDDKGHRESAPEEIKYRARQNVILELGMVLARLGRSRVAILYKESVERPSDIDGLLYLGFKEKVDEVKSNLFKELQAAGYTPDHNAL